MAANNNISVSGLDHAIDVTIAEADRLRVNALIALQEVLCAEATPLVREKGRLEVKLGAGHARVAMIAERIEINQGFALEAKQEAVRARLPVVSVSLTKWATHGLVKNMAGDGLPNLTVALYDGPTAAANWVQEFGYACTDSRGYFELEANNPTATKVFLHVRSATATLYLSDVPLMPQGGVVSYNEIVITGESLGCPPPLPPPPPDVDLKITITDTPDPVTPNADLIYTLTVTNLSQTEAKDLKVIDTLPSQTTFVSASGDGFTCTHSNGVVSCTSPNLAAGATATITIIVKVSQDVAHATVLNNTANVTATASDPDTSSNTAATTTTVVSAADLSITKTDTPDPVMAGQNITYALQVTNPAGASAAQSVTVTDSVPANTTFVSAMMTSGAGWTPSTPVVGGPGKVVFSKASMAAGESAAFQIVVKVSADTTATSIINTAKVASPTIDPNADNNTATVTTNVTTPTASADLSITKTDTPDPVMAGQNITYGLLVTNPVGAQAAQSVTVTDSVPANTTFVSAMMTSGTGWTPSTPVVGGPGKVVFSKASMAAGESAAFQIVVKVNADTTAPSIINTAKVASPTIDPNADNNTATTTTIVKPPSADLSITKTDTPDPVMAGQNITYALQVTNPAGASAAQSVTVTDSVPANTTFVSAMMTSGTGWTPSTPAVGGPGKVVFSKASMAAGESAAFQIVVKVNADTTATSIINTAKVASPTIDPNADNNTATVTTNVNTPPASADLQLVKTDDSNPVAPGGNITYTLTLYNAGPSPAQGVTVTDATPANTTFVSANGGAGWAATLPSRGTAGNAVFSKAVVAPGETATFQIVVNVNQNTPDSTTITNTAMASSPTSDPNTDNNLAIAKTPVKSPGADLSIAKTVAIAPGGIITYLLTLTNNGPNAAETVKVTDPIPPNTAFVLATVISGAGWATNAPPIGAGGSVVFSKASVASGETATFQIVVKLNPGVPVTTINNTATVTSSTSDPDPTHNTVEASVRLQVTRRAVVFFTEVNSTGDHSPLQGSAQPSVTFTDNVPNSGDLEAAFSGPQAGFKMKQFKAVTMAVVSGPVDADIKARLKAVISALQNAGGAGTLTTSTIMLSAKDRTALAARGISLTEIDEVIFLELASAA